MLLDRPPALVPPAAGPLHMINVSFAIQNHPQRAALAAQLAEKIGGVVDVVSDPDPDAGRSPWRTYRHVLETTPADATHRLVIQDDAEPCAGFADAVRAAVTARPHRLLVFFVANVPAEHHRAIMFACDKDEPWAVLRSDRWCPAVCCCWPVGMIQPFLGYVDAQGWPASFVADDEIIGRYLAASGNSALGSVPSLVEHPDVVQSLLGRRAHAGDDRGRVAGCLIPDDCDASSIDWTVGPG